MIQSLGVNISSAVPQLISDPSAVLDHPIYGVICSTMRKVSVLRALINLARDLPKQLGLQYPRKALSGYILYT